MPELPEVETIVRGLRPWVKNRKITGLWTDWPKYLLVRRRVAGKKIINVARRGKNVLFALSGGYLLLIHQKISGHLLVGKWKKINKKWKSLIPGPLSDDRNNQYIRLIFFLDNGKMIALSDLRRFAKVLCGPREKILNLPDLKKLGPEALALSFKNFQKLFGRKKGAIKQVLMNQNFIAGIGNIYSDEILWLAKIHPLIRTENLTAKQIKVLHSATRKILNKALKLKGTSIDDYRAPSGEKGKYEKALVVYQREGKPCPRCKTPIKRIKLGGRGARFCPKCQTIKVSKCQTIKV